MSTNKYLFLDRDGVINSMENGFANAVSDFIFCDGVLEAMPLLNKYFDKTFVVTNQAGIGYGYMTEEQLNEIHAHMLSEIAKHGGHIDQVYYSPDRVSKGAASRKPNSGMALQAQQDHPEVAFPDSYMIGDRDTDIEFGQRLGMKTVFVLTDEDLDMAQKSIKADHYVFNLLEFAQWIDSNWK